MLSRKYATFLQQWVWLLFLIIGLAGAVLVYVFNPQRPEVSSLWQYISRMVVFLILFISVAFFPNNSKNGYLWLLIPIFVYAAVLAPLLDFVGFRELTQASQWGIDLYYMLLYFFLYPFIIACITFSYRLGGGSSGNVIKLATVGLTILFSGVIDIMFRVITPAEIPKTIDYDFYFKLIVGHFPSFQEQIIFALLHIPIILVILIAPIDKWLEKLLGTPAQKQTK